MNLRALLSLPLGLTSFFSNRLPSFAIRQASTMAIDNAKMNGFFRDGYCWGSDQDPGKHFIGAVVTDRFLEFSRDRGNDLMTQRPGFPGLKEGCRWCLCVERWKEAMMASEKLGPAVVPKIDLNATALDSLKKVSLDDLKKYRFDQ